jgi:RNA polymerase sigma-70 factor (ECF subfamily)
MDASTTRRASVEWGAIHRTCLGEARRILGPGARADDAAQEAALRAWRHWDRRRHSDSITAWVRTIARNEAYRLAGRARIESDVDDLPLASCDDALATRLDAVDLRRALQTIDSRDRHLLHARYWQDLPHAETARQLGLTESAVRLRLHRLHHRLRALLSDPA